MKLGDTWVVLWFPPDAPEKRKSFNTEFAARNFAKNGEAADWHPLLEHYETTMELIQL